LRLVERLAEVLRRRTADFFAFTAISHSFEAATMAANEFRLGLKG
jgi:hypothetical protein